MTITLSFDFLNLSAEATLKPFAERVPDNFSAPNFALGELASLTIVIFCAVAKET